MQPIRSRPRALAPGARQVSGICLRDLEMTASESEFDPIGQIADEFVARLRRGEAPSITEYTSRHPENADRIRAALSALKVVEKLKPEVGLEAALADAPSPRPTRVEKIAELIGDYRIIREIGRGGMGV